MSRSSLRGNSPPWSLNTISEQAYLFYKIPHFYIFVKSSVLEITHKSAISLNNDREEVKWEFETSEEDRPGTEYSLKAIEEQVRATPNQSLCPRWRCPACEAKG